MSLIHRIGVIDLGPEGGEKGGYILFEGTVENLLKRKKKKE